MAWSMGSPLKHRDDIVSCWLSFSWRLTRELEATRGRRAMPKTSYRRLDPWSKLGVWGSLASLVGVIGLPVTIYSFLTTPSGLVDGLPPSPLEAPPTAPISRGALEHVKEMSAGEIVRTLAGQPSFNNHVRDLYLGRWIREPGWQAWVRSLPGKEEVPSVIWRLSLTEDFTGASLYAITSDESARDLREHDAVFVVGRIVGITSSYGDSVYINLDSATLRRQHAGSVARWWARNSPLIVTWIKGPIGWIWCACVLFALLTGIPWARRRMEVALSQAFGV